MFSVAIIGPDGAGKTTIARRLENSSLLPIKYLYMGINIESSNVALPTSRFIERVKRSRSNGAAVAGMNGTSLHHRSNGNRKSANKIWATIRLVNRIAEEWYRQILSWNYRRNGMVVVYDRHFKFDFELDESASNGSGRRFTDTLHRWFLARIYPTPDLVIYLDAPAEVLFARKGEATLEYLDSRRQAFLRQGEVMRNFVTVDATQPAEVVYAEVVEHLLQFQRKSLRSNG